MSFKLYVASSLMHLCEKYFETLPYIPVQNHSKFLMLIHILAKSKSCGNPIQYYIYETTYEIYEGSDASLSCISGIKT